MFAATCLTLAVVQGLVWWRRRQVRAHALFALAAVGTALLAWTELWMMHAETPVEIGHRLRWFYAAAWLASISLVGFMRQYLRAGRRWLAWAVYGARTLTLIINFALPLNLGYRTITGVRKIPFLGQSVSVAVGVPSPWLLLGQFSLLLLVLGGTCIPGTRPAFASQARALGREYELRFVNGTSSDWRSFPKMLFSASRHSWVGGCCVC